MLLFKTVKDLQARLHRLRVEKKTIGFVPTMGALHQGHLSLIQAAIETNDVVVCSIFVNPTQFNESSDLEKYPRTPGKDLDLLISVGCHVVFMPLVDEIYPPELNITVNFDLGGLELPMEGANRPGHFEGVVQVVHRLIDIVQPNHLFMGQKDFQQYSIIRRMLYLSKFDTQIVMCPIMREHDGLAMSSRNVRLKPEHRKVAPIIHELLLATKQKVHSHFPRQLEKAALERLQSIPELKPEYFEIVDGYTLQPFEVFEDVEFAVACTAVWAGDVRLIDNMILKGR